MGEVKSPIIKCFPILNDVACVCDHQAMLIRTNYIALLLFTLICGLLKYKQKILKWFIFITLKFSLGSFFLIDLRFSCFCSYLSVPYFLRIWEDCFFFYQKTFPTVPWHKMNCVHLIFLLGSQRLVLMHKWHSADFCNHHSCQLARRVKRSLQEYGQ